MLSPSLQNSTLITNPEASGEMLPSGSFPVYSSAAGTKGILALPDRETEETRRATCFTLEV